jgi:hypothetical protein
MSKKRYYSSGKISTILLILAAILVVVIIVVFVVIRITGVKNTNTNNGGTTQNGGVIEPPKPVYEATISDIRFIVESAQDLGNTLKSKTLYQQELTTTEKFIKVVIGVQNKGKTNTPGYVWDVGNIVDSDGRNFVSINDKAYVFLPNPNLCGALLKPEFDPVPCVKFYEVSKASTKLKIQVNTTSGTSGKKQEAFLDLDIPSLSKP